MIREKTDRGFTIIKFKDIYDNDCSIQESSLATEEAIWLGISEPNPQIMAKDIEQGGNGWVKYSIPPEVNITTRMHLNKETAKKLVEVLNRFINNGNL